VNPPMNIEVEREVIGTLLAYYTPQLVHKAQAAGLIREDFYRRDHQIIYRAILHLHAEGGDVDHVTVAKFLRERRDEHGQTWLSHAGGNVELLTLYAVVNGFRERCAIVHEDGCWRRWLSALTEAFEHAEDRDETRFWEAVRSIRPDVMPSLHVVKDDAA
jgi:replicative DNA helicase